MAAKSVRPAETKIRITPLMRAVWHEMMARADPTKVSPTAVRIGVQIGTYFNNDTAETYVSLKRIASDLRIGTRSVWAGVHALKAQKLLIIRRGGRGSNFYRMPLENVAAECEIRFKSRSEVRDLGTKISQKRLPNLAAESEQTLSSISLKNSLRGHAPTAWDHVKGRLSTRLGPEIVEAWFKKVACDGRKDDIVTLAAPTKFLTDWIRDHYSPALSEAWSAVDPSVRSVRIIFRTHALPDQPAKTGAIEQPVSAPPALRVVGGTGGKERLREYVRQKTAGLAG